MSEHKHPHALAIAEFTETLAEVERFAQAEERVAEVMAEDAETAHHVEPYRRSAEIRRAHAARLRGAIAALEEEPLLRARLNATRQALAEACSALDESGGNGSPENAAWIRGLRERGGIA